MLTYKPKIVLGLRTFQIICIGFTITGILWASSDILLTTVLVGAPVTPLSVLLMLYGSIGTLLNEAAIRMLNRKGRKDFLADQPSGSG